MSKTDKDRPYIVRLYDKKDTAPRYVRHFCGIYNQCDHYQHTIREAKILYNSSRRIDYPSCRDWLIEDRNNKGDRENKVIINKGKRRTVRQWCHIAKYFPEADGPRYNIHWYGAHPHKDW